MDFRTHLASNNSFASIISLAILWTENLVVLLPSKRTALKIWLEKIFAIFHRKWGEKQSMWLVRFAFLAFFGSFFFGFYRWCNKRMKVLYFFELQQQQILQKILSLIFTWCACVCVYIERRNFMSETPTIAQILFKYIQMKTSWEKII